MFSPTENSATTPSRPRSAGTSGMSRRPASAIVVPLGRARGQPDAARRRRSARLPAHGVGQLVHAGCRPVPRCRGSRPRARRGRRRAAACRRRRAPRARPARSGRVATGARKSGSTSAPTISSASPRGRVSATGSVVDHAAAAQHGDAVGDLEDLVEAVRDVQHARAARCDLAHHREAAARPRRGAARRSARRARARRRRRASPAAPRRSRRPSAGRASPRERPVDVEVDVEALEDAMRLAAPARAIGRGRRRRARSRRAARGCPSRSARGRGRGPGGRSAAPPGPRDRGRTARRPARPCAPGSGAW